MVKAIILILVKQRLSLTNNTKGSNSLLKLHKATITVQKISEIQEQLKKSLNNYIQQQFANEY
ncbi:hypothetical protein C7H19_11825 [Aphanothece hegewaldii CCALA 016]|uniref:Uncharacterized protein n=1 Tax=Aphanothece hegewaldii CCALA 016 TaxID=2107694 RepID=A0A2T1LXK7_9CHRO|nr:hypothetical protein C7H19_11825 [Aphanothece hegewaldii CCALA 016]